MKILTWNINGIRASKVPLKQLFDSLDADIICLQETKVTRDQLDERTAIVDGYNSFYSFSRAKSGYSGVATYVKEAATPIKCEEGLSGILAADNSDQNIGCYGDQGSFTDEILQKLDNEGRAVITQHRVMTNDGADKKLTVINVYCPRADPEREDRKEFKLQFYHLLQIRAEALLQDEDNHVIVLGDVNTSHKRIDHCEPDESEDFEERPGRKWLNQFLFDAEKDSSEKSALDVSKDSELNDSTCSDQKGGTFVDTFRYFHPKLECAFTCWATVTNARVLNYGTRIDYIIADRELTDQGGVDCVILPDVQGSDHCPVKLTTNWAFIPSKRCPPSCTRYWPEFQGRQQKLSAFLVSGKTGASAPSKLSQESLPHSQDADSVSQNKRPGSAPLTVSKKPKLNKSNSAPKQSTLSSFFSRQHENAKKKPEKSTILEKLETVEASVDHQINYTHLMNEEEKISQDLDKPTVAKSADAWKNLLKGPAPAPLCKGHQESCVLRTVKKDSLNKGRQFYVCARPEGPKTNPESRCDHFEWVSKKPKTSK